VHHVQVTCHNLSRRRNAKTDSCKEIIRKMKAKTMQDLVLCISRLPVLASSPSRRSSVPNYVLICFGKDLRETGKFEPETNFVGQKL
jgi:hypothetical protein